MNRSHILEPYNSLEFIDKIINYERLNPTYDLRVGKL